MAIPENTCLCVAKASDKDEPRRTVSATSCAICRQTPLCARWDSPSSALDKGDARADECRQVAEVTRHVRGKTMPGDHTAEFGR